MAGYFGQTYELRFENGAWLDITNYIDSRQTKVTDIGCTEELKGGISTCKVELRYGDKKNKPLKQHSKIVGKLLAAKANNELVQFRMSGQVDFVGKIDLGNFSQTNSRIPGFITLDCEDNSYLLNEMMESFEYPDNSDLADIGYTIFDENNKSTSIVVQRLLASGYALSDIDFNASDNITELVRRIAYAEDENTTYRDFLNTLLFEHCAILYMRGDGKFVVKRLYKSNPVAIRDVDFAQKNGITTQAGNYQSDGEVVAWSTLSLDTERNIYVSNISLSRDDDGKFVGEEIQPNHYWPPDGDIEETWQEYNANFLDRPYTTKESRLRNKDISIISAKNVQAEIIKDNEMIIANNPPEIEPKRARFLFYNNDSVNVKKMYAFALKGDVLYRSKRNESTYPVGSRIPNDPYESTYLYNADGATRLVNHLYRFRKYGDIKHRWVEFRDVPNVFDIVTVSAPDTHISTLAMVLSRNITIVTPDTIKAEIGAVSITPFNSEPPKTRSVALGRLPVETGLDGAPGPKVVIQYALGTEEAPYSDKGNLLGTDDTLVGTNISLVGVEGGNIWTDSVPTPSEGEYVWRREGQYTPPAVWPKVWEVTRLTGEGYSGIELTANPKDIIVTKRGLVRTPTIRISAAIRGTQGDIEWSLSEGDFDEVDEFTIDIDATTVLGNETIVTAETDKYEKELTINKIIVDTDTPINFGMIDAVGNIPKITKDGDFLIEGDYFLWGGGIVTIEELELEDYIFFHRLEKGQIYEYGEYGWSLSTNGNLVMTMFDSIAEILEKNPDETSQTISNAVIGRLAVLEAFVERLMAQDLEITNTGAIRQNYDKYGNLENEEFAGFYLGGGKLKANDAELIGTLRTGEDAPHGVRVGIKDKGGFVDPVEFDGTGNNDLVIVREGHAIGEYEVVIEDNKTSMIDTFVKFPTIDTELSLESFDIAYSPDGQHLALSSVSANSIIIYKRSGDNYAKLLSIPMKTLAYVAYSPDGQHLVTNIDDITIFKRLGDTYTELSTTIQPPNHVYKIVYSPDNKYFAILDQYDVKIYKRAGDTYTESQTLNLNSPEDIAFSADGLHLAVADAYDYKTKIFKRSGDTFSLLSTFGSILSSHSVAYSHDNNYLAIYNTGEYVYEREISIFKRTSDSYSKIATIDDNTQSVARMTFSPNGDYLALGCTYSPFAEIYKHFEEEYTKIGPIELPRYGFAVAFSPDNQHLAFAHHTTPTLTVFGHAEAYDSYKWRKVGESFSDEIDMYPVQNKIVAEDTIIRFPNMTGHDIGDKWEFKKDMLHGLSIVNSEDEEYVKAFNGTIGALNFEPLDETSLLGTPTNPFPEANIDKVNANTINTGQGNNKLYAMNQNVRTTDSPTFATVNATDVITTNGPNKPVDNNDSSMPSVNVGGFSYATSYSVNSFPTVTLGSGGTWVWVAYSYRGISSQTTMKLGRSSGGSTVTGSVKGDGDQNGYVHVIGWRIA